MNRCPLQDTVALPAPHGVQSIKERRALRFGMVSANDLNFQVKTLEEIRAGKKRKLAQQDNVESSKGKKPNSSKVSPFPHHVHVCEILTDHHVSLCVCARTRV